MNKGRLICLASSWLGPDRRRRGRGRGRQGMKLGPSRHTKAMKKPRIGTARQTNGVLYVNGEPVESV